jgi:hypothetical protein
MDDISRKDAKVVNQGILAGISATSGAAKFNDHFGEDLFTPSDLKEIGREVYGETYDILHKYNKWGNSLYNNANTSLIWTRSDGVKIMSTAFIKGQEVIFHVPTTKGLKLNYKVTRNMPLLIDNDSHQPLLVGQHAKAKMHGFLANSTHGECDSLFILDTAIAMHEEGEVGFFIHDNIGAAGIVHKFIVRPIGKQGIERNIATKPFLEVQKGVAANYVGKMPKVIDYSVNDIPSDFKVSDNFLQA